MVAFVVKQGLMVTQLIQVCAAFRDPGTREREVRSLPKASEELHCKDLLVLTENEKHEDDAVWCGIKGKIRYVPLWKWF